MLKIYNYITTLQPGLELLCSSTRL